MRTGKRIERSRVRPRPPCRCGTCFPISLRSPISVDKDWRSATYRGLLLRLFREVSASVPAYACQIL
ncbi:hypothetical protein KC349_g165 [Hortaea werneckii]|nr:hypothetical protein KC349_g165 [Hortaea werneckii]